jgi:MFS superfamily sulfate permease-like transporter
VLIGFLTGVGIQVACGELDGMLGLEGGGHSTLGKLWHSLQQLGATNFHALSVSLGVLAVIVGSGRVSRKIPGALIAVVGAIVLSRVLDLQAHLPVLGEVPSGLPHLTLPRVEWTRELVMQLLPTAFAMFVVILAQSAATSRAYASRYNEQFSENTDLVGLGMANIGAALTGTFVVNGSPTKTQMVDSAGGRTQLTHLTTVLIVLLVLLFLTEPLASMPEAVLSSVVFLVGIELIDIRGMRRVYVQRQSEFWIAVITAATVVLVGVEQGILLAMAISLLDHTRRGYRPKNTLLFKHDNRLWRSVPISQPIQALPGLMIYHFSHSMYYANAECLAAEVNELTASPDPPLRWFCLELSAVDDVDFSAAETIRALYDVLKTRGIRLVLAQILDDVKKESRYDMISLLGRDAYYETLDELLAEYAENVLQNARSDSPEP